jgi:formate hydrogenlyase subunit 3/multisubunit Na+/H+ antiporter MnhD subunit
MMLLIGFALLLAAAFVGWLAGRSEIGRSEAGSHRASNLMSRASWLLSICACILLVIAGALGLAGRSQGVVLSTGGLLGTMGVQVDAISGMFLVISFGVAVPATLATLAGDMSRRPRLPAAVAFVLISTELVICADNLFVLLAGWESLGFAFYLAVGYDRHRAGRPRASILAMGFSKISGAALLIGGLLLAAQSHTFTLSELGHGAHGAQAGLAYALLVFAFATKVGLVPLHIWLPPSYAAAPGPARAILAGVAVNGGFYGLWRTLDSVGAPPDWLAGVVLVVAGISAILGISHAAVHANLASLIAWSSVENAGLILAGYGVALVGAVTHSAPMTAAGLVAATAQVCAHALGKTILFISAADVEDATGTMDLDRLRGVVRTRPISGVGLIIGSFTLAGLPLTAGFASEWLTLEALMQQFRLHNLPLQLCTAVAAVLVALTIGVASIAFVRVIGLTAFGHPSVRLRKREDGVAVPRASWSHAVGILMLIVGCLGAALFAPLEIRLIAQGVMPIVGDAALGANASQWILQPVFDGFSALSPTWLWIVIPAFVVLLCLMTLAFSGRRFFAVRRVPAWTSASLGVAGGKGYTSFGYANPIRKVLAALLMTRHELREEEERTGGQVSDEPGPRGVRLGYVVDVVDIVERYFYRPLIPAMRAIVAAAKRLQSGRLDAYMAYMLVAVVAVIAVVTSLANR